jgi:hypothetical protein
VDSWPECETPLGPNTRGTVIMLLHSHFDEQLIVQ